MIVRELVTLLKYDVDRTGIDEYQSALKKLAGWIAGLFAAHEVMEIADEWNTVAGRVTNVTDSVEEQTKVMKALQDQSELTGQSFEGIGSLFAQLESSRETIGYTTDQVLGLTNAVSKLVTLGGGTAAGGKRGMIQLEEMFALDKVQMQHLRSLMIDIPGAAGIIAKSFGGMKPFMALVHEGKITGRMLADAITAQLPEISRRFGNMPTTFSRAFQTVRNFFGGLIYDIGKASHVWSILADGIIGGGRAIVDTIRWMADEVGGFTNLLETLGIVLIAAFGPGALAMIGRLITAIRGITVASVLAAAPWYIIAALILAVGLAVQDVWTWMQGGASITEDLIGPWSEWKDTVQGWRDTAVAAFNEVKAVAAGWGPVVGGIVVDVFEAGKAKAYEWRDALSDALSGHDQQFADLKAAFVGLLPTDMKAAIKEFFDLSRPLQDMKDLLAWVEKLFPALAHLSDGWTLGKFVHDTLVELTELLRLLGAPATFLNNLQESVSGAGTAAHDYVAGKYNKWFPSAATDPSSLVPPSSLIPPGAQTSTVNAPITVNLTTASDTPQAVGDAAAKGARIGFGDSLSRGMGIAAPQAEYGMGY